jgi:multiple sugar transport system substrate-binding protein
MVKIPNPLEPSSPSITPAKFPKTLTPPQLAGYPAYVKRYPGVSVFVQNEANAVKARPVIANYNEVSQAMGQAIEAVLLGKGQPQQELDQAAEQANQTLATGQ